MLFNRFYQLDIDIESITLNAANHLSSRTEMNQSIRWITILGGSVACDIAAGTGVEDASDVVKLLLSGAQVVQLCSTLYRNGFAYVESILRDLEDWMERNGLRTIDQFRGRLSLAQSERPGAHERLQYIQALTGPKLTT